MAPVLPVPCTLLTGALGSGKTTIIRALMTRPDMAGTALIVNEFGEVGLDHLLLSSAVETTLLMDNGCLCCSLRGDVIDTVLSLFGEVERGETPAFDRIIIETTGLADPIPIVRDLTTAPVLKGKVRLERVVTCVDGLIGSAELAANPVAIDQVAQADVCLITKEDLADPLAIDLLRETLVGINPSMDIAFARQGRFDRQDLFDGRVIRMPLPPIPANSPDPAQPHEHSAPHTGVDSWSVILDRPLPWSQFRDWLDLIYSLNAARMLRMKGLLWIRERDGPLLVQAAGPVVAPLQRLDTWPGGQPETRLVLITKGLAGSALAQSFAEHILRDAA